MAGNQTRWTWGMVAQWVGGQVAEFAALYLCMSTINPNRQPQGQPTGGRFAAKSNPESELDLEDSSRHVDRSDARNILYVERDEDDGSYVDEVKLPTRREVCWRCDGNGTHTNPSIDGNGITSEEMAEWDDDEREGYLSGRYDVVCEECHGRNVVDVVDADALSPEQRRLWSQQLADEAGYRAEVAAERRMGA